MDESCGRKTIFDVGVRPKVYHEWDVFEFHLHNFKYYVSRTAPYELDLGKRLAPWHDGDIIGAKLCIKDGIIFIHTCFHGSRICLQGTRRTMILNIRNIDGEVVFQSDESTAAELKVQLSTIMQDSSSILRDGTLAVELWMKLAGPNPHSHLFRPNNPILQNILSLFGDEDSADVFFKVDGIGLSSIISAHLLVLKACAPTLAALCKGYDKTNPVPINDISRGIFNLVLYYIYGGRITSSNFSRHSKELMEAANLLDIPTLKVEAEGYYVKSLQITVDNFVEIYQYAEAKAFPLVKEAAVNFFLESGLGVLQSASYIEATRSTNIGSELLFYSVESRSSPFARYRNTIIGKVDRLRRELYQKGLNIDGTVKMMEELLLDDKQEGDDDEEVTID